MKNAIKIILSVLLLVVCLSFVVGCNNTPNKEEIAYKMICYVAEDYDEEPSNITLRSGRLKEEDNGNYFATFKVSVNSYTMYFCGTYYVETGKIEYIDMTRAVNNSIVGAGPAYYDTESFDIAKVNKKLQGD